jgi:putative membrane protein
MMGIEWLKPAVFFGSMLFALIGVGIFWLCFVIVDKLTPYDLWGEIIEKKNVALAIVVGSMWPPMPMPRPGRSRQASSRCSSRSRRLRAGLRAGRRRAGQLPAGRLGAAVQHRHRQLPVRHGHRLLAEPLRASVSWWRSSCASSCWSAWSAV